MLLTLVQHDRIGPGSIVTALLQFPLYGALLGWSAARRKYLAVGIVGAGHVLAAIMCFSGWLANFS